MTLLRASLRLLLIAVLASTIAPVRAQESAPADSAPQLPAQAVRAEAITLSVTLPLTPPRSEWLTPLRVTLENAGADFKGRLVVSTTSWIPTTQYYQAVELPAGSTKQFWFTAFEGANPEFEVLLLGDSNEIILRHLVQEAWVNARDVVVVQIGGHRNDFSMLQGDTYRVRRSLEEVVEDVNLLRSSQSMAIHQFQEPEIPEVRFRWLPANELPLPLIDLQGVTLVCMGLGTLSQLDQPQRLALERYVRLGGMALFYPELDYGFPTGLLEDPLLPVPLQSGFDLADPPRIASFAQRFAGWEGSPDRPLRFLRPEFSTRSLDTFPRLLTPDGCYPLLLSRPEGLGRTALLLFQPTLLTQSPEGAYQMLQLLDRSGLMDASEQQWYVSRSGGIFPGSGFFGGALTGGFWYAGNPLSTFWLRNWAQRMHPDSYNPFRAGGVTRRLWTVPLTFLRVEGWKLAAYLLLVLLASQWILAVRQRMPGIWAILPLLCLLFVLSISAGKVKLRTPYQYAEWNILRFAGVGDTALLASGSWVANLSRHGIPVLLSSGSNPDYFFDEFVFGASGFAGAADFPTVRHRQGADPAIVEITPLSTGRTRLYLGWGPVPVAGQLQGTLDLAQEGGTLTIRNTTPWTFGGGTLLLENEYVNVSFDRVPAVPAGESVTVPVPAGAISQRALLTDSRGPFAPTFTWATLPEEFPVRNWVPAQAELLHRTEFLRQSLRFVRPAPEFAFHPEQAQVVGHLEGYESPLRLDDERPEGQRFTVCTIPVTVLRDGQPLRQQPFGWVYWGAPGQ